MENLKKEIEIILSITRTLRASFNMALSEKEKISSEDINSILDLIIEKLNNIKNSLTKSNIKNY